MTDSKKALMGIYTLAIVYTAWAVYFLFHLNNPVGFIIFAIVACLYEIIAKSIKKAKRGWITFGIVLLIINILDGVSSLANKFAFGTDLSNVELSFYLIVFVVSIIFIPSMFKVRKLNNLSTQKSQV